LFKGCLFTTLGLILTLFLFHSGIARLVTVLFGAVSFLFLFAKEEILRKAFRTELARAQYRRRFLLVGSTEETARMRGELRNKSPEAMDVVAELDLNQTPIDRLVELLHEHSVNGVIISAKRSFFDQVEAAVRACELEGIEVWLMADFFKTQISRTSFDDFYGHAIMVFRAVPEASWESVAKQLIDFFGAAALLVLSAPFLVICALLVRLTSQGPIFFRQQRSGLNGRPFTLYKFRTMVTNAEQLKHELAAMNEMSGPVFKLINDPRITRFGRFLRRSSIDELPQLYNVLRGEMSLVGPRPLPVDEVKRFNDLAHRRRLSVKPGLTCLWQVSGRNKVKDFKDWVRLDLEYIDNWSLWLDLKIICRTLPVVLTGAGAS
jgi:exopolysaccharide biosynthesis polyprenyl glycosylphosphotransferase